MRTLRFGDGLVSSAAQLTSVYARVPLRADFTCARTRKGRACPVSEALCRPRGPAPPAPVTRRTVTISTPRRPAAHPSLHKNG
ncbi:hypothetical protein GCM10010211_15030 [Streptomyces albospinus]|uniref:Uncharacterized protein n=1 Tax=Streptomyces albospinus TaxID=285515 RepID=A0ABQ2UTX0_9ACTN|nr:hypothetical protein GCM10010211_15030 [Streptomyces albospinus]